MWLRHRVPLLPSQTIASLDSIAAGSRMGARAFRYGHATVRDDLRAGLRRCACRMLAANQQDRARMQYRPGQSREIWLLWTGSVGPERPWRVTSDHVFVSDPSVRSPQRQGHRVECPSTSIVYFSIVRSVSFNTRGHPARRYEVYVGFDRTMPCADRLSPVLVAPGSQPLMRQPIVVQPHHVQMLDFARARYHLCANRSANRPLVLMKRPAPKEQPPRKLSGI